MAEHVRIYEVGPRDGLQNEKTIIPADKKITLVDMLSECGFERIEVTSFVSPKWVPQLADAALVMSGITRNENTIYAALAPNLRGAEAALEANAQEIAIFASASEGFSQKNINCSIAESLERFKSVAMAAHEVNIPLRGYVSCVTDCPYDGATPPKQVADVASALLDMGCYEISLGDTIGKGNPQTISTMLDAVLESIPAHKLAGHYHNTGNLAIVNIEMSLEKGLRVFDAAIGGLGGCPYAPGAAGNVSTIAVANCLDRLGYETNLDMDKLKRAENFALGLVRTETQNEV